MTVPRQNPSDSGQKLPALVGVLLRDLRIGHSETQLDWFVMAAHGVTVWGAYQQALREIRVRSEGLDAGEIEAERLVLRRDRAAARTRSWRPFVGAEARLDLREIERARIALETAQADRRRELGHLVERAAALRARIVAEGELTPERVRRLDDDHWYTVVRRRIGMELCANDRLEPSTLGLFAGLPVELRRRVAECLKPELRGALVSEAMTAEGPEPLRLEASPC